MSARVMRYTVVVRHPETDVSTALLSGEPVPGWAKGLVQDEDLASGNAKAADEGSESAKDSAPEPDAAADAPSDDADTEAETPSYGSLKKDELQAEIDQRNTGRDDDDQIVVEGKGNVPDLVAALEADDAAQSDTDN